MVWQVLVPIIPLALLPANTARLGAAFGVIEVMYISMQMAIIFMLGMVRMQSGYAGAFQLILGGFTAVLGVSGLVITHGRDHVRRWPAYYGCGVH
jgi:hypothetical protein